MFHELSDYQNEALLYALQYVGKCAKGKYRFEIKDDPFGKVDYWGGIAKIPFWKDMYDFEFLEILSLAVEKVLSDLSPHNHRMKWRFKTDAIEKIGAPQHYAVITADRYANREELFVVSNGQNFVVAIKGGKVDYLSRVPRDYMKYIVLEISRARKLGLTSGIIVQIDLRSKKYSLGCHQYFGDTYYGFHEITIRLKSKGEIVDPIAFHSTVAHEFGHAAHTTFHSQSVRLKGRSNRDSWSVERIEAYALSYEKSCEPNGEIVTPYSKYADMYSDYKGLGDAAFIADKEMVDFITVNYW